MHMEVQLTDNDEKLLIQEKPYLTCYKSLYIIDPDNDVMLTTLVQMLTRLR